MVFSQSLSNAELSNQNDIAEILRTNDFLKKCDIDNYKLIAIPSDASKRKYYRVLSNDSSHILMDASLDKASVAPFIEIGSALVAQGLSAPKLHGYDQPNGLLLLEDLGEGLYTKVLSHESGLEKKLYNLAIDVLVQLYRNTPATDLPVLNAIELNRGLDVFAEWYLKENIDRKHFDQAFKELIQIFARLYPKLNNLKQVMVLRDYMADNLLYLPEREGVAQVGLLDFQDAALGSPAYDIVSLLEDARRDVSAEAVGAAIEYYLHLNPGIDRDAFMNAYAILGMQRNMRIVGVFNRLAKAYNKPRYLNYLPRVWGYINAGLEKPILSEVKNWFETYKVSPDGAKN